MFKYNIIIDHSLGLSSLFVASGKIVHPSLKIQDAI